MVLSILEKVNRLVIKKSININKERYCQRFGLNLIRTTIDLCYYDNGILKRTSIREEHYKKHNLFNMKISKTLPSLGYLKIIDPYIRCAEASKSLGI